MSFVPATPPLVPPFAGGPVPAFVPGPAARPPLPDPVDYVGLTRPGRRWWRILLSLAVFGGVYLAAQLLLAIALSAIGLLLGWNPTWFMAGFTDLADIQMTPGSMLYLNLSLAAFIPATIISIRVGQGIRWGFVHSVAGRFRWGLFGQLLLLLLPVWLIFLGVTVAASGGFSDGLNPHPQLWGFLAVIWLTTALQCAGEEYAFRVWLLQNVGGLFGLRILAWVLPVVLSAVLFGLAHGSLDPWILGNLMVFAVAAGVITWRSGGIEGAVALHTVNNLLVMHLTLVLGGFDESFIGADTTSTPVDLITALIGHAVAVAVVWWWLKRRGVVRTTTVDPRAFRKPRPVLGPPPGAWYPPQHYAQAGPPPGGYPAPGPAVPYGPGGYPGPAVPYGPGGYPGPAVGGPPRS